MEKQETIVVERPLWSRGLRIHFGYRNDRGELWVAAPAVLNKQEDGESTLAMLEIAAATAQSLMDQLWHAGIRPTEAKAGDGQIEAMKEHLKDMRRLVFELPPTRNDPPPPATP